jgi:SAM-dependent methyltransferase
MMICHVCGDGTVDSLLESRNLPRITSDCVPVPGLQELGICEHCWTLVTATSDDWRSLCTEIYASYSAYRQAGGGEDAVFFADGQALGRSSRIVSLVTDHLRSQSGRWLDFGCGNGTFLKVLGRILPEMDLIGMEYSELNRTQIMDIEGVSGFCTSWDDALTEDLDVVSLIHVLEHIENPRGLLEQVARHLTADGTLIVQVPHVWSNPYMLAIADHASHFGPGSLSSLVSSAGFEVGWVAVDVIPGELTLMARRPTENEDCSSVSAWTSQDHGNGALAVPQVAAAQELADSLGCVIPWLHEQRELARPLAILGTSIAGTWAASALGFGHDYWVDEDPSRQGRTWHDRPVMDVSALPPGTAVLAVLAPAKARAAVTRLSRQRSDIRFIAPPSLSGWKVGLSEPGRW